jgi:hypothetical protein
MRLTFIRQEWCVFGSPFKLLDYVSLARAVKREVRSDQGAGASMGFDGL